MRKIYWLLGVSVIVIIGFNVYYYFDVLNRQIHFHEAILKKQLRQAVGEIHATTVDFENELHFLMEPADFDKLFTESAESVQLMRETGLFFSKYHNLISRISIFDTKGNAFSLTKDSTNYFKKRIYQNQEGLDGEERFQVHSDEGRAIYNVPVRSDAKIAGKLVIHVELRDFYKGLLENYNYNNRIIQWLTGEAGHIIYKNRNVQLSEKEKPLLSPKDADTTRIYRDAFKLAQEKKELLVASAPVRIMNSRMNMMFALPLAPVKSSVVEKTLIAAGITFFILFLFILAYIFFFRQLRKKNEDLNSFRNRFNSVVNGLEVMILITDIHNEKVLFTNASMKQCEDFDLIKRVITRQDSFSEWQEIKVRDKWFEVRTLKTLWTGNQEAYLYALLDATARKESEEKVARSEDTFRQIFNLLPLGIFILDENEKITEMNEHAADLFHMQNRDDYLHKEMCEALELKRYKNPEENHPEEHDKYILPGPDNESLVLQRKRIPVVFDKALAYLETFLDITSIEEKRKGEALANKAKSQFIANLSHEIRTPLNGVTGMADALLNEPLAQEPREYAEIMKKSADLLQTIINDLLDFSKIESGRMELEEIPFQLKEEVEHAIYSYRIASREKGLSLELEYQEDLPRRFIGDPFRLKQVLTNLISNAIKFTQEGTVRVSVERVRQRMGLNILLFTVEDSGIGIPNSKIQKIFESFTQADTSTTRKFGGTGLGTSISKQLVELMGGEIWAESPSSLSLSEDYPGSKFIFTVELYSDEKRQKKLDVSNIKEPGSLNVLIVDNEQSREKNLCGLLEAIEANVTYAQHAAEAIELLQEHIIFQSRFHLVFIDDREDFNGFEIMQRIYHSGAADWAVFVLTSSNDKPGNYLKSKRLYVDYYLIRPCDFSEVKGIIRENFPNLKLNEDFPQEQQKQPTLLVAEDNPINQKVIRTLLKSLGYETEMAKNGDEVLLKVREKPYDLIFMDILMPHCDGIQATKVLRQEGFDMPVIALTGGVREKDLEAAEKAGMNGFLSKPVKLTNLKNMLLKWTQALGE